MKRATLRSFQFALAVCAILVAFQPNAEAGPPLTCHPFDIGAAKSLPWTGDGWNLSGKSDYDLGRLVEDTQALLTPGVPVIVRMETLRRAALYARKDQRIAKELLARLRARAQDAEAKGRPDALAWFDLGYLVETYKQVNLTFKKLPSGSYEPAFQPNAAAGLDGYAWVQKAITLRGQDPEMEFAAALITAYPRQKSHDEHLQRAIAGATDSSLLAINLHSHFGAQGSKLAVKRPKPAAN